MVWRTAVLRILGMGPILLISSVVVFLTLNLIPGHAAVAALQRSATPQTIAAFNHRYGLDRPLYVQYLDWLTHAVRGDFGKSLLSDIPVGPEILTRIPITSELALLSMGIAIAIGLPLGIVAAARHGRRTDTALSLGNVGGMSVPNFALATLFVYVLALGLKWLPVGGYVPFTQNPIENVELMLMPALSMGIVSSTILFRIMRASMIDVLAADYIRTAVAKGLPFWMVIIRHALKNALVPFLTIAGIEFSALFGGAVIIEQIFFIPGLGSYVYDAISARDYFELLGSIMLITTMVVVVNGLVDVIVIVIDPRRTGRQL